MANWVLPEPSKKIYEINLNLQDHHNLPITTSLGFDYFTLAGLVHFAYDSPAIAVMAT